MDGIVYQRTAHALAVVIVVVALGGCDSTPEPEVAARPSGANSPNGTDSAAPGSRSPSLKVQTIQAAPSQDTDCSLPDHEFSDAFGVPKDDVTGVYFHFAHEFRTTQEFGVVADDPTIATTSGSENGPHEKVILTIEKGSRDSSPFWIRGKSINKTKYKVDKVTDTGDPGTSEDDVTYAAFETPITVWEVSEKDIVDYNDLGGEQTCQEENENSPDLKPDPGKRISCGAKADAIAADGVSYQLIRLKAGGYGKVCFTVLKEDPLPAGATDTEYYGRFSDPLRGKPGEFMTTILPTSFQATAPDAPIPYHWALGTYTPPTDFFDPVEERTVKIEVQFTPANENGLPVNGNLSAKQLEIKIRRSPVLLVHGLWSDHCTWGRDYVQRPASEKDWRTIDGEFSYDQPSRPICDDGSPTPEQRLKATTSFAIEQTVSNLRSRIRKLIDDARAEDMAITRVDVVAHSMGGLLSKRWMNEAGNHDQESNYRNWRNFQKGGVRKLVTLHTPHSGSQIGNLLIHLHNHFGHDDLSVGVLESRLPGDVHRGALCALAENSTDLMTIRAEVSDTSGFAFVGTAGRTGGLHPPLSKAGWLFPLSFDTHVTPFVFTEDNDAIVAGYSQRGGLPHFPNPGMLHSPPFESGRFVTAAADTANQVYRMLDVGEPFSISIPGSHSTGDGVPRPGIGEHPEVNAAADYAAQCAPGGPMRRQ